MKKFAFLLLYFTLIALLALGNIYAIVTPDILHKPSAKLLVNSDQDADDPVPIEFPIFSATVYKQDVHIQWSTRAGLNITGFEIERRPASYGDWTKIGYVEGSGTASNINYYEFWDYNVPVGSHSYRYKQFGSSGGFSYSEPLDIVISPPDEFMLYQNYPNPFNPSTVIRYQIPDAGFVKMSVYDVLGSEIEILVSEYQQPGFYEVEFFSDGLTSGVYVLGLQYGGRMLTKKMVVLK